MFWNCSLILKFHLLIREATNKIRTKNRKSKSVYGQHTRETNRGCQGEYSKPPVLPDEDDADNGIFDDTLCKILGAPSRVATSLDLDLAFGAVDVNVDLACTSLLSPLSPLPLLLLLGSPFEIQEFSLS